MSSFSSKFVAFLIVFMLFGGTAWAEDTGITDDVHDLIGAACDGKVGEVRRLLDKGVDINARYLDFETALIFASLNGQMGVVKLLVARGANVNARDERGKTALAYAEEHHHDKVRDFLVKHGAQK
jgi:ankyrin repeat protein